MKRHVEDIDTSVLPAIDWDKQPLGDKTDIVISRELAVSESLVTQHRMAKNIKAYKKSGSKNIDWNKQPLGKVADAEIARRLGVFHAAVRYARVTRGIDRFNPPIDWSLVQLGEDTDFNIARKINTARGIHDRTGVPVITRGAVTQARLRLDIKAKKSARGRNAPSVALPRKKKPG